MKKEPKKILLVEKNLADSEAIETLVDDSGHFPLSFVHVYSLEKAIGQLAQRPFDAVLLRVNLPDVKGLESVRRLHAEFPSVPVVVLTPRSENGLALEALEAGAEDYLVKEQIDGNLLTRSIRFAIERKHFEQRLRQGEARYRSLVERVPAIIYTAAADRFGSTVFVSPQIERLLGFTEKEWCADSGLWSKQLHVDDRDRVLAEFETARRTKQPFKSEYRLISRSGKTVWFSDEATIDTSEPESMQCYQGVMVDISVQKESEEVLAKLQRAIDQSRDVVFMTDVNGAITYVNPEFRSLYGLAPEEVIGLNPRILKSGVQGPEAYKNFWETIAGGKTYKGEFINKTNDHRLVSMEVTVDPVFDARGAITGFIAIQRDITTRKQAEKALLESNRKLNTIVNNLRGVVYRCRNDHDWTMEYLSGGMQELSGYPAEDFLDNKCRSYNSIIERDDRLRVWNVVQEALAERRPYLLEYRIQTAGGEVKWVWEKGRGVFEGDALVALEGFISDITERKRAEVALRGSEEKFRGIFENVQDVYYEASLDGTIIEVSPSIESLSNGLYRRDELLGRSMFDFYAYPEERQKLLAELQARGSVKDFEIRLKNRDGSIVPCSISSKLSFDAQGLPKRIIGSMRDNTERKRAEEALRESEERLRILFEFAPDAYYLTDLKGRFLDGNRAAEQLLEYSRNELIGKDFFKLGLLPLSEMTRAAKGMAHNADGQPTGPDEVTLRTKGGKTISVEIRTFPVTVGQEVLVLGIARDISGRKRAERALAESENRYRKLFEDNLAGAYITKPKEGLIACNAAFARTFGYSSTEEALTADLTTMYPIPSEREEFFTLIRNHRKLIGHETELRRKDGKAVFVIENAVGRFDERGELLEVEGFLFDNTERRLLQQQLMQAQKMESIGTLAGGIAHDFNNILGIILGHLSLLERTRDNDTQFKQSISTVGKAVERGASLVRQILTFARRAEANLEPVNINATINELAKMLGETFPKTITLTLKPDKTIPFVSMDPAQLHQSILNLCVNARDAMNGRGTLTLSTHLVTGPSLSERFPNASADHYVRLCVADTGSGMDEEIKQKIFEPFFTTKEDGKGTGLGLAVVYGVMRSHNGFIDVESESGKGSTFNLYFPVPDGVLSHDRSKPRRSGPLPGGSETILVVEDEPFLRDILTSALESAGYTVILAFDGEDAVAQFGARKDEIDLVISDQGLPKRNGWEAFKMMRQMNPAIRGILATGFVDESQRSDILKSGIGDIIGKPYFIEDIFKIVRRTLDDAAKEAKRQ